ncbi:MAG: hypothetical protein WC101_05495 [Candidatus Gracilibacteria bacterium]
MGNTSSGPSSSPLEIPPGIDYAFRGVDKLPSLQYLHTFQESLADFAHIDLSLIERMGQYVDAPAIYEHLSKRGYPHGYDHMLKWIAGRRFPPATPYLVLSKDHLPPLKGFDFPMILLPNNQRFIDMARDPKQSLVDRKRSLESTVHGTRVGVKKAFRGM